MKSLLEQYGDSAGKDVINHLRQLAKGMQKIKVVHINSTKSGGGVAEILNKLVPLKQELGIEVSWEVLNGNPDFFECTKRFHNALQGKSMEITEAMLKAYEDTSAKNAEILKPKLKDADIIFAHDPQPAMMKTLCPGIKAKWIWRCHIDVSNPQRKVWKYLKQYVAGYDASVFSIADFAQTLPHTQYLIPPSIDPLSDKNKDLPQKEIDAVFKKFKIDKSRPVVLQVSRFDEFKDPVGVIHAYRMAKKFIPLQLILAGGFADDDPEGARVLDEVKLAANSDPDVHVLVLPPDAHTTINALQRGADIILQKSLREGFGLTVTEAMWKSKPVIGGDTGGIRCQVINHHTGFLVSTPEGAALRMRYLLQREDKLKNMGEKAREFVRGQFLITRHLRDYLTVMTNLVHGMRDRIELS
ncbi:MAG: glycosyltransferase [bacterium]